MKSVEFNKIINYKFTVDTMTITARFVYTSHYSQCVNPIPRKDLIDLACLGNLIDILFVILHI